DGWAGTAMLAAAWRDQPHADGEGGYVHVRWTTPDRPIGFRCWTALAVALSGAAFAVPQAHATDYAISDPASCASAVGGSWDASSDQCDVVAAVQVEPEDTLTVTVDTLFEGGLTVNGALKALAVVTAAGGFANTGSVLVGWELRLPSGAAANDGTI